ncbi:unnamed protein product [Pleuronectes platessa]|uniref:Uncharacterized protein n=1 Tax=Pleuronectes platessa TaxID=8262 RepID=A0A9N7Z4X2_PLEPL|nr:unnamed protein product [Pleuronectes platessa]
MRELKAQFTALKELVDENPHLRKQVDENPRLRKLVDEYFTLKEREAEYSALKEQTATNNLTWETERYMVEQMESPASLLLKCHMDLIPLTQRVESAKAREKELEEELGEMNMRIKVKEEELVETEEIQIEQKEKLESLLESCEEKLEFSILQHWASSEKREEPPPLPSLPFFPSTPD